MKEKGAVIVLAVRRSAALLWIALAACSDPASPPQEPPGIVWQVPAQGSGSVPLILDSLLIVGSYDGSVIAFDRQTGKVRWKRELLKGGLAWYEWLGAAKQAAGFAIVPMYWVWAIEPRTGVPRWFFAGPDGAAGWNSEVAVSGDTVFTASASGWVSAVDAQTGLALWNVDLGERPFDPTVAGDLVIYGTRGFLGDREGPFSGGHAIALRRRDGSEAWRFPLPDLGTLTGGATNGGTAWRDRVIIADRVGRIYALRLEDGKVIWSQSSNGAYGYSDRPATVEGVVILPRTDNMVEGRDARTGILRWTIETPSLLVQPVAIGRYAYIIEGPIVVTDTSGKIVWKFGGLDYLGRGLSFFAGTVAQDGMIYTLGVERGTQRERQGTYVFAIRPAVKP